MHEVLPKYIHIFFCPVIICLNEVKKKLWLKIVNGERSHIDLLDTIRKN